MRNGGLALLLGIGAATAAFGLTFLIADGFHWTMAFGVVLGLAVYLIFREGE